MEVQWQSPWKLCANLATLLYNEQFEGISNQGVEKVKFER
jgi:hypothetical protein